MDFVQRNLINERNNLQVELAKAKALIAELSEATNYNNSPNKVKSKLSEFEQGRKANDKPKPMGDEITKNSSNKPKPTNEQAEYISDLENVIISIAEQLGVHPNDLLDEGILGNVVAKVKNVLGIKSPKQRAVANTSSSPESRLAAEFHKKHENAAAEHNSPQNKARREAESRAWMNRPEKPLRIGTDGKKMTRDQSDIEDSRDRHGMNPDNHL